VPKAWFNPLGYEVKNCVEIYFKNFLLRLRENLEGNEDDGKIFRTAVYLTLLNNSTRLVTISEPQHFQGQMLLNSSDVSAVASVYAKPKHFSLH
jgi:hypothetical protein